MFLEGFHLASSNPDLLLINFLLSLTCQQLAALLNFYTNRQLICATYRLTVKLTKTSYICRGYAGRYLRQCYGTLKISHRKAHTRSPLELVLQAHIPCTRQFCRLEPEFYQALKVLIVYHLQCAHLQYGRFLSPHFGSLFGKLQHIVHGDIVNHVHRNSGAVVVFEYIFWHVMLAIKLLRIFSSDNVINFHQFNKFTTQLELTCGYISLVTGALSFSILIDFVQQALKSDQFKKKCFGYK